MGEYDALLMLSEEKIVNSKMKQVGRFPYDGGGGGGGGGAVGRVFWRNRIGGWECLPN